MKISLGIKTLTFIACVIAIQSAFAGWNHQCRRSCYGFAKYSASANAGYKAYDQMGNYVGSSGYSGHDTGCGYAHVGPYNWTVNNVIIAHAESSIGSIGTIGSATTSTQFDAISNLRKVGMAGVDRDSQNIGSNDTLKAPDVNPYASNLIVIASTTFSDAVRTPKPAQAYVMLSGISGHLSAQNGYSTFEIIVTLSKNETPLETDKIVWKGKAIVHDNRLTILDGFPKNICVAKASNPVSKEIAYTLNNVDIKIPVTDGAALDDVVITTKGDAGDKSILTEREYAAVVANKAPLPVVSTEAISVIYTDKNGKHLTKSVTGN